jgi:Tfp pilus assembly protein PilZ
MVKAVAQRVTTRYPVIFPVRYTTRYRAAVKAGVGWTRHLSVEGANVELDERLRPQTPLRLHLETDRGSIDVRAKVVWVGEVTLPAGGAPHGLVFTEMAPPQSRALRELLLPLSQVRHAGIRLTVDMPVTCQRKDVPGTSLQGRAVDISRGGLSLRLPRVLPLGTELAVTLNTPSDPIRVEGSIVWAESPDRRTMGHLVSHGVRFTSVDWSVSLAVGLLLAHSN